MQQSFYSNFLPVTRGSGTFKKWLGLLGFTACFTLLGSAAMAQVTTNSGSGLAASYPSLASAVTALNAATITDPVIITVTASETAPAGGYSITAQGTAVNTITIDGGGFTVTAPTPQTSGNLNDALIKLVGADYVIIQNFTFLENAANTTTTAASNNMTEWGIALLYATTTNGAQNCTIQNNTITLNRTYQNTFGIYANSTHAAGTVSTSATATTTAGGNSGLKVYTNNISNVNLGIVVVGPTAAADMNTGIDIGGSGALTGNTITNFGTTGTFSSYANVSGTVNGILLRNSINSNISYNTITSSVGGTTAGTLNGIQVPAASTTPTGTFTNNITNNNISLQSAVASGSIVGITYPSGSASTTSTLNINYNNFSTIGHTIGASGTITFISTASTNQHTSISYNTFTNISCNTTGSVTFISQSFTAPSTGSKTVNNNSIVTGFTKTGAGGTVIFVTDNGSTVAGALSYCQNNNFSNVTLTGATAITGVNYTDGGAAATRTVTDNILNNWTTGAATINAMNFTYWNGASSLSNNSITNINGQGAITGVTIGASANNAVSISIGANTINNLISSGTGGSVVGITCSNTSSSIFIAGNNINTLSTTAGSAVNGIAVTGATNTSVSRNKIYDLSGSNASSTVNGILVSGGTLITVSNNLIGDLRASIANAANPVNGLNITGGTTVNAYYNTVHINPTSSGALFGSSAVSISSSPTATLRNNIFVNNGTTNGAAFTVAYRRSSTTLTSYGSSSNNNLFYAGIPGATNVIFYDGTNNDQTIAEYKTRVTPRDAQSDTENPPFASTTGSSSTFLHFAAAASTRAESAATNISSLTDDYDSNIRQGNPGYAGAGILPDIGADEFEGTNPTFSPLDMGAIALFAPAAMGCFTSTQTVTVTVKNHGTATIDFAVNPTTVDVSVTGAVTQNLTATISSGTLAPQGTQNVDMSTTIDMSAVGSYTFNGTTVVTGDGNSGNDAMLPAVRTVTATAGLPQTVDFTGFTGTNLTSVFPNWSESTGATLPSGTASGWTNATLNGTTTAKINLFSNTKLDWIVGPKFTALSTTYLTFKVAITDFGSTSADPAGMQGTDDKVIVRISTDCGATFTDLFTFNAANTIGISNTLVNRAVNLGSYAGQSVIIAFFASEGADDSPDYDFHIDDINIGDACSSAPLAGTADASPAGPFCGTGSPVLTVTGNGSGNGVTVQWYSATTPGGPYTAIAGATASSYTATGTTASRYFVSSTKCFITGDSSLSNEVAVIINANPTVAVSPTTGSYCGSGSVELTASGASTYNWSPAGGLSATTGSPVTATPSVTTTYSVIGTDGNGCTGAATATVTVNAIPTAPVMTPSSATVCSGGNVILNAASSGLGNVSGTIGTGALTTTLSTTSAANFPNVFAHYYGGNKHQMLFLASELTSLGLSAGSSINSIGFPVASVNRTDVLQGFEVKMGTTALTVLSTLQTGLTIVRPSADYTTNTTPGVNTITLVSPFSWDGTSNLIIETSYSNADAPETGNVTMTYGTTTGVKTLVYRADNIATATMNAYTGSVTYSLSQRPNVTFGAITTVQHAITWAPSTGLSTTVGNTVIATPPATTTYTATATSQAGCTSTNTVEVTVAPGSASISGNATICAGQSTDLTFAFTGTAPYSVTYSNGAGNTTVSDILTSPHTVSVTPAANSTYTIVSATTAECAIHSSGISGSAVITLNPLPSINITGQDTICEDFAAQLFANASITGGGTFTYQWYEGVNLMSGEINPSVLVLAPGSYTVTATANNGCSATSAPFVVSMSTITVTASAGSGGSISPAGVNTINCGSDITFTITPDPGFSIEDILVNGVSAGNSSPLFLNQVMENTTVVASFLNASCVNNPTADAGANDTICSNSAFTLGGSIGGSATTATWSSSGTGAFSPSNVFGTATTYTPSAADSTAGFVILTLTTDDPDGAGPCAAVSSGMTLLIYAAPYVSISGQLAICPSGSITLTAVPVPGNSSIAGYQWTLDDTTSLGTLSTQSASAIGTYAVTVTDTYGCSRSASVVTTVADVPSVDITGSSTVCIGEISVLTANTTIAGGSVTGYQWLLNGSNIGGATSSTYNAIAAGNYTVTVSSNYGCTATSAIFAVAYSTNPLSGTYTIGSPASCTQFLSIANFVTSLNQNGVSGSVLLQVPAGYTEIAPAGGLVIKMCALGAGLQSTAANTITIQKTGAGANPVITAFSPGTSTTLDGVIKVVGTDYITFDGIDVQESAGNTTNTQRMEMAYGIYKCDGNNGAVGVSVINSNISLNKGNTAAIAVRVANTTETGSAVTYSGPTTDNFNEAVAARNRVTISDNAISNVYAAVSFSGNSAATGAFSGNDSAHVFTNNVITNFAGSTTASVVVAFSDCRYFSVNNNNINGGAGTNAAMTAISGGSGPYGVINGNTITLSSTALTTSAVIGITYGASGANNNSTISNNIVQNCSFTAATSAPFTAITSGLTGATSTIQINNNQVLNNTLSGTGTFIGVANTSSPTNLSLNDNTISGNSKTSTGTMSLISQSTPTNTTISNNIIANNSMTGGAATCTFNCILGSTSLYTYNNNTITNNGVTTMSGSSVATIAGITNGASALSETITNNTIRGLYVGGTSSGLQVIRGIYNSTLSTSNRTVSGNTVDSLYTAAGVSANATAISSLACNVCNYYNNKISNILPKQNGTSAAVAKGFTITSGTVNVYNNLIGIDVGGANLNGSNSVIGIEITGGTATNVHYNTIRIAGSSTLSNFGSSGISITSTTPAVTLRNNIVQNLCVSTGTGASIAVGLRRSATALTGYAAGSNNNLWYAGTPSVTNVMYYDGTTAYQSLANFKAQVATREANSVTEAVSFTSVNPVDATYLHITAGTPTLAEGGGTPVAGVTTDYDGDSRNASAPDIGADEGAFTGLQPSIIALSASPATGQCTAVPHTVTAEFSSVVTSSTLSYAFDGTAQTPVIMTNTSGNIWSGVIPAATPVNALVTWSVTGSDGTYSPTLNGTSYKDAYLTGISVATTATPSTICAGASSTLNGVAQAPGIAQVGTGTSTSTSGGYGPFYHGWGGVKTQHIFLASELQALGLAPGPITALSLDQTTAGTTLNNFAIAMGHTTQSVSTTTAISSGLTEVYSNAAQTMSIGIKNYPFSTPFIWDGTSNIVVSYCYSNANTGGTSTSCRYTALGFTSSLYIYADNQTAAAVCAAVTGPVGGSGGSSTHANRANTYFYGNIATAFPNYSWSDGVGVVGTTQSLVVNPTTTTNYTLAVTDANGCSVTGSVTVTVNQLPDAPVSAGSTQCGVGIPTAKVTSTSIGIGYNWYLDSTGGTAIQSSTADSLTSYSISATTTFYVAAVYLATGCESARTPVLVTVNTPDAVTAAAAPGTVCPGETVNLSVSQTGSTNTYEYTWTGPNLNSTSGAAVTASPATAGTATWTVTATDTTAGCVASSTASVTVTVPPLIVNASADPSTICAGATVALSATTNQVGAGVVNVGNGTATITTNGIAPFSSFWETTRIQYLYTAADLTAAGMFAGPITKLNVPLTTANSLTVPYSGYTIKMGHTSAAALTATWETGLSTVYGPLTQPVPVLGNNVITFSTPFTWDGVSGIVMDICFSNDPGNTCSACYNGTLAIGVPYTTTANNSVHYQNNDGQDNCGTTATGTLAATRPNIGFDALTVAQGSGTYTWVWNPGSISGNTTTVTPLVTTNYVVTATDPSTGCSSSVTVPVTVNPLPAAPVATNSVQCGTAIPAASVASATSDLAPGFTWYSAASGGTVLQAKAPATGPLQTYYSNDFSTGLNGATLNGSASLTAGVLQLTPNVASQLGGVTIAASGRNADKYNVSFDLITAGTSGADGLSYNFGDDVVSGSTSLNAESGTGTKLKITFDAFGTGNGAAGIRIVYGTTVNDPGTTVGSNGILAYSSDVSWINTTVPVVADINALGQVTLTVNSVVIFSNVQLPAAYLSANKASWLHVIKARTGGSFQAHSIDNLVIQQSAMVGGYNTYLSPISQTTTFYVSETNSLTGCESSRTQITATATQPDSVAVSASAGPYCLGSSVTLTAGNTGTSNSYAYTWNGPAGSGFSAPVNDSVVTVTPTSAGIYVYTVTAVDGICTYVNTITIEFTDYPTILSAVAEPSVICAGQPTTLTALTGSFAPGLVDIGAPSTSTIGGANGNPYRSGNGGTNQIHTQLLIRASEMIAAGFGSGSINSLGFTTTSSSSGTIANLEISMGHTTVTDLTTTFETTPLTTVFTQASFTPLPSGLNTHNFTTPFLWDGVSNILINVCQNNDIGGTATVQSSAPGFNANVHAAGSTTACSNATGAIIAQRPIMQIGGQIGSAGSGGLVWTWNPGGLTGNVQTVSPAVSTSYIVTATHPGSGCSTTDTVDVTVNPLPAAVTATDGSQCGFGIPTASVASNSGFSTPVFNWYTVSTGGTAIQSSTSSVLTTYSISTTTTFYVSEVNTATGCESPRVAVVQTVSQPDSITANASVPSLCLPYGSVTLDATQTGSTNTYSYSWTASPAVGSGMPGLILGPVATLVNTDFSSLPGNVTLNGTSTITPGYLQFTSNTASQSGSMRVASGGNSADSLSVEFDLIVPQTGGADGLSYSFADDGSLTSTAVNYENGTGTKLTVSFDSYVNGSNTNGIYLMYNPTSVPTPTSANVLDYSNDISWAGSVTPMHVAITVTSSGLFSMTLNGSPIFTNIQLPAAYVNANKSTWSHYFKARTGAITEEHGIDNLVIRSAEYQSAPFAGNPLTVTPTAPGTYTYTVIGTDGGCNAISSVDVLVNPAAASINAGPDQTICSGSSATINATGAGLIPTLRFTEVLWQVNAGTGNTGASIPSFISAWYGGSTTMDMFEITNLGAAPTFAEGVVIEIWNTSATTAPTFSYTVPAGGLQMASGSRLYFSFSLTAVVTDFANNFFTSGSGQDNGSGTAAGVILRKNGTILDAVAVSGFTFPVGSGVTASDWSGSLSGNSGLSGSILTAADNNTSSSWTNTSAGTPANLGVLNPGLVANLPSTGNVTWTSIPPGFSASTANITVGPLTSTTQYVVQFNNGTCSSFDTITVNVLATPPKPIIASATDSVCLTGSTTLSISNDIPGLTYQWLQSTSATGPWSPISLATNNEYATPVFSPIFGDTTVYYRVIATCGVNNDTSLVKSFTVLRPYLISTTPGSRCGIGTVTLNAFPNTGLTVNWYAASTGGSSIGTGSGFVTPVISTTTTFYASAHSNAGGGCESSRVPIIATVTTPPSIAVSSATTICNGKSATLTVSSSNDPSYSYVWTPGNIYGSSVIVSPTVSTVYTVTATDTTAGPNASCANVATVSVLVNPSPVVPSIVQNPVAACDGTPVTLTASATEPATTVIGTGTTTTATIGVTPYTGNWEGEKIQYLILASELTSAGVQAGLFDKLAFNVTTVSSTAPQQQFSIKMAATAVTSLTGYVPVLSTVYTAPGPVTPVAGWNNYNFNTPFNWNGIDNIVVEVCHNNDPSGSCTGGAGVCYGGSSTVQYTATGFNSVYGQYADNDPGSAGWDLCSQTASGTVVSNANRPNMQLGYNIQTSFQWSNGANTAATTFTPPPGTSVYTVTATNTYGCTNTATHTVIAQQSPKPIVTPTSDTTVCFGNIIKLAVQDTGSFAGGYPVGTTVDWIGIVSGLTPADSITSDNGTTYQALVTVPGGCSGLTSVRTIITRSVNTTPTITNPTCGQNNGKIVNTVSGGSAPYRFVWSQGATIIRDTTTNNPADSIYNLAAGTYTLEVTDSVPFGCSSGSIIYTLNSASPIVASITTSNPVSCNGSTDGVITATYTGGTGTPSQYTYLWNTGAVTNTIGSLAAGQYTVTITDLSGCSDDTTFTLTQPDIISAVFTQTTPSCPLASDGALNAVVSGGTAPYQILEWYDSNFNGPFATGTQYSGIPAGDHVLYVMDNNSCEGILLTSLTDAAPAAIDSFAPVTGPVGTVVTIYGQTLGLTTAVSFNGFPATFNVVSNTMITATVPVDATTGTITVVTQCGTVVSASPFTVTVPSFATFNLTAFMQGYYIGGSTMNSVLVNQAVSLDPNECDTVTVELRDPLSPSTTVYTAKGLLNISGQAMINFPSSANGQSFYIVVNHRSSIQTWSALPVTFSATTTYNYSTASSQAFGDNMFEVEPGVWAFYAGDLNQDGFLGVDDVTLVDDDNLAGIFGVYVATDVNGDGFLGVDDVTIVDNNNLLGIFAITP